MDISALTGSHGGATTGTKRDELGKEDFLKLLVAQLMHQDPLKPDGDKEFIAQLAQFSSLEQLMGIGSGLDGLAMAQLSAQAADTVGFIGKDVLASADTVQLPEQGGAHIGWSLVGGAAGVNIEIRDNAGALVRTIELNESQRAGNTAWHWDGEDDDGRLLPKGPYTFSVKARTAGGDLVPVEGLIRARVTGVTFERGYPELRLGAQEKVMLSEVREVAQ